MFLEFDLFFFKIFVGVKAIKNNILQKFKIDLCACLQLECIRSMNNEIKSLHHKTLDGIVKNASEIKFPFVINCQM